MNTKRILGLDLLKIFAIFFVLLIHLCFRMAKDVAIGSFSWYFLNFLMAVSSWSVFGFTIISAKLYFLKKNVTYSYIVKKVIRILIVLIAFSLFYDVTTGVILNGVFNMDIVLTAFKNIFTINGMYHLWYLYILPPLYLLVPAIERLLKPVSRNTCLLIIFLTFIICNVLPFAFNITLLKFVYYLPAFLMGYFLANYRFGKTSLIFLAVISSLFLLITPFLNTFYAQGHSGVLNYIFVPHSSFSFIISTFLISAFSNIDNRSFSKKSGEIITSLALCTFGIYLVHEGFNIILFLTIEKVMLQYLWALPLFAFIVFTMSYVVVRILRYIPFVRKFI